MQFCNIYSSLYITRHQIKYKKLLYLLVIDLFTDSYVILNFCPVDFCLKWTLYFVSTSKIMIGNQFSINFYEDFDHGKILIYPVARENFTTLDKSIVKGFL